jgi:very-short-patch-repair endonuclease
MPVRDQHNPKFSEDERLALDTTHTDPRSVLLEILRISRRAHSTSELRTLLHARGFKKSDYEVTQHLRVLRNEGSVSLDRRRWSIQDVAPKTESIPSAHNVNGAPTPIPQSGQPLPSIDGSWTPRKSWMFEGAEIPETTVQHLDQEAYTGPWGTFRKLLGYYIECVRKDGGCEASANLSDFDSLFTSITRSGPWYPQPGHKWIYTLPATESLQGLFLKLKASGEAGALVLGYPIWIYSDGDSPFMKPVFTYQLDYELVESGLRLTTEDPLPDINYDWLRYSLKETHQQRAFLTVAGLMNRNADEEAAGDKTAPSLQPHFGALGNAVMTFFGHQVREPLRPEALNILSATDNPKTGIYNHAVIMAAKRTRYTQSLLKDLSRIQQCSDKELDSTALKRIFRTSLEEGATAQPIESIDERQPEDPAAIVVDNLELNSEQRSAVASLISNDITVVTGPPGTGKSQVVVSAVANARLLDQKVLFTSRNHKAIDSVVLRPEMMTTDEVPIIVRANDKAGDISFNFSNALSELLSAPHDTSALGRADELKKKKDEHLKSRGELTKKANLAVDLRDKIAEIEEELSRLSDDWSEEEAQTLDRVGQLFPIEDVLRLSDALARLPEPTENLGLWQRILLWFFSRPVWRLANKTTRRLEKHLSVWSQPLPHKNMSGLRDLNQRIDKLRSAALYCRGRADQKPLELAAKDMTSVEDLFDAVERETKELIGVGARALSTDTTARVGLPPNADRQGMSSLRTALRRISNPLLDDQTRLETDRALEEKLPELLWHYPAWAVTNLSISSRIPLVPRMFDVAIIDEASQCDIPSAIPILFRAKRAGVVGDRNQLSHTTNLSPARNIMLLSAYGLVGLSDQRFSYIDTSLFDLFAETNGVHPIWLLDHYRCAFGIAEYANKTFYGSRLRIATAADRLRIPQGQEPGIHWTEISAVIEPKPNGCAAPEEAEAIATLLRQLLVDQRFEGTVGVVTPFQQQKQLINSLIYSDSELSNAGVKAHLIVDTAHGFQGDERDVMFMSLCAGPDMPKGSLLFLGKTANLLNVAATRARAVLHIVGNKTWAIQCGIKHISSLARPWRQGPMPTGSVEDRFESPWEKRLYYALVERGLKPIPQYPLIGRRLDFALVEEGKQSIDLEVDGARYHLEPDGSRRRDDIWRDITVRGAGWKVMRFWVHELRDQMDDCLNKIEKEWGAA